MAAWRGALAGVVLLAATASGAGIRTGIPPRGAVAEERAREGDGFFGAEQIVPIHQLLDPSLIELPSRLEPAVLPRVNAALLERGSSAGRVPVSSEQPPAPAENEEPAPLTNLPAGYAVAPPRNAPAHAEGVGVGLLEVRATAAKASPESDDYYQSVTPGTAEDEGPLPEAPRMPRLPSPPVVVPM